MFFGNAAWKQLFMGLVQTLTEGMDITYLEEESEEQISIDYDLDEDEKKIMLGKEYFWIQELFIFSVRQKFVTSALKSVKEKAKEGSH